jgi:hypothetical protein
MYGWETGYFTIRTEHGKAVRDHIALGGFVRERGGASSNK